mmetsp:Transcript_17114/g.25078  ORF Transcript_17114/g.25078 Transcript_17114/m.25078 type:complete len:125 (+) Transcript_17114:175-549(+)
MLHENMAITMKFSPLMNEYNRLDECVHCIRQTFPVKDELTKWHDPKSNVNVESTILLHWPKLRQSLFAHLCMNLGKYCKFAWWVLQHGVASFSGYRASNNATHKGVNCSPQKTRRRAIMDYYFV